MKDESTRLSKPDPSSLKGITYPSDTSIQPEWIARSRSEYVEDHGMHKELVSTRELAYKGHSIRITTSYRIEIDGYPQSLHMIVGNDGRLFCHTVPYEKYTSAIDLVTSLIDRFPDAFTAVEAAKGNKGT